MASLSSNVTRKLRVGLVGCGKMGLQHLGAISAAGLGQVVAVADPMADRASLEPLLPPGAEILADAEELLTRVRPDVVHIVTPPHTHARLARQALEAGSHVYVEKPFTPTLAEAAELITAAARAGRLICPGHQYLFERPNVMALQTLPEIGRLSHVESYFSFRMVRRTITPCDQAKDILPHAVYPMVAQLRKGSGQDTAPIEMVSVRATPQGDVYALVTLGGCTGILVVTLSGRPVEQYQHLSGTNGWLRADYITGSLTHLSGPGAGLGVLFTPYRRAWQTLTGATKGFTRLIFGRKTSYPGLTSLIGAFYEAILQGKPCPISPQSILDTVGLCEAMGDALDRAEAASESTAKRDLLALERQLPPATRGAVLVTGGTGLLGRKVVEELRWAGFRVRTVNRRLPLWSQRAPGVEYVTGDLARGLDPAHLAGISAIAHCAAETAGGQLDHERNSIDATRHLFAAAALAGVRDVVHISSLAVLTPGAGRALNEQSNVDHDKLERGPYVWGKARSEALAQQLAKEAGIRLRIIRPGPLVDYRAFSPPGRLGRELGPFFVAIGGRRSELSVCDVTTAARVIRSFLEGMDQAPPLLNMIEAPPPTRQSLMDRFRRERPDLRVFWFPGWLLRFLSGPLKLVQRVALGSKRPLDVYAAFASERYDTTLAGKVIERAGPPAPRALTIQPDAVLQ